MPEACDQVTILLHVIDIIDIVIVATTQASPVHALPQRLVLLRELPANPLA
jgi:hypothetical protein